MSSLSMVEARLPPGFRFHPRDDELVLDYLSKKLGGGGGGSGMVSIYGCPTMIDVDLNKCEPWDLPEIACVGGKDWYFYSLKDRKYATGQRTNRATESGYWKATGKDRLVSRKGVLVGMRKTLVFYQGRAPKGKKTEWVMHEFREEGRGDPMKLPFKEDWVLCRVFYKSRGPIAKPTMENSYTDTGSTSLPPLVDTYIAFEQALARNLEGYEQVPCFSNPSQLPPASICQNPAAQGNVGSLVGLGSHCDSRKAITDIVLSQFGSFEGSVKREMPPNFAQDGFDSYVADQNGLAHMWNSF